MLHVSLNWGFMDTWLYCLFLYRYTDIYTHLYVSHKLTFIHTYIYTHRYTYTHISSFVDFILFYFGSGSLKTSVSTSLSNPGKLATKCDLFKTRMASE